MDDIKNYTLDELKQWFNDRGYPSFHAKQIFPWIYQRRVEDFSAMTDLSKEMRSVLAKQFHFSKLKLVKQELGIEEEETTPDLKYTLETVACIGVCALAPNMVVNSTTYGHLNPKKVAQLFSKKDET